MLEDIEQKKNAPPSEGEIWFHTHHKLSDARVRLFCFPYAGGSATAFHSWFRQLAPCKIEVWPVQFPGREERLMQPLFTAIPSLIEALLPTILPYLDVPFAFFGHSVGALIAFELVRALRKANVPLPIHLFASARNAPQIPVAETEVYKLPDKAFIQHLQARYNGIPRVILNEPELMEIYLRILRADFSMVGTYIYQPEEPIACPITAFGGLSDKIVTYEYLRAWEEQTSCTFKLRMLPGDHFFLRSESAQMLQIVVEDLQCVL